MAWADTNIERLRNALEAMRGAGDIQARRHAGQQEAIGGLNQSIMGGADRIMDVLGGIRGRGFASEEAEKERGFEAEEGARGRAATHELAGMQNRFAARESEQSEAAAMERLIKQLASQERQAKIRSGPGGDLEAVKKRQIFHENAMAMVDRFPGIDMGWPDSEWRAKNKDAIIATYLKGLRAQAGVSQQDIDALMPWFEAWLNVGGDVPPPMPEEEAGDQDLYGQSVIPSYDYPGVSPHVLSEKFKGEEREQAIKGGLDLESTLVNASKLLKELERTFAGRPVPLLREAREFMANPKMTTVENIDKLRNLMDRMNRALGKK